MQRRIEQQARSRIVNAYFDRVAEIEEMKYKWICFKIFLYFPSYPLPPLEAYIPAAVESYAGQILKLPSYV